MDCQSRARALCACLPLLAAASMALAAQGCSGDEEEDCEPFVRYCAASADSCEEGTFYCGANWESSFFLTHSPACCPEGTSCCYWDDQDYGTGSYFLCCQPGERCAAYEGCV